MITYIAVLLMLIAYDAFEQGVWVASIPVYTMALGLLLYAERKK